MLKSHQVQPKNESPKNRRDTPASNHRHRGAEAALEPPGQLRCTVHGHGAKLAHGLAAAANEDGEALVAIGLDAIWEDVHYQGADLAAASGADHQRERSEANRLRAWHCLWVKDRYSGSARSLPPGWCGALWGMPKQLSITGGGMVLRVALSRDAPLGTRARVEASIRR